ncbi:hypothetical protein [Novosphingobium colocasiae]|uniref:hypothetical protein n=1 Tax=Novosphingobium colocasiae TaxID=1256513 RepID=UPI0035B25114
MPSDQKWLIFAPLRDTFQHRFSNMAPRTAQERQKSAIPPRPGRAGHAAPIDRANELDAESFAAPPPHDGAAGLQLMTRPISAPLFIPRPDQRRSTKPRISAGSKLEPRWN